MRRLPVGLVAGGALLGAAIGVMSVLAWPAVDPFTGAPLDGWAVLCRACYLVASLWPLFLIITTIGYVRHRRPRSARARSRRPMGTMTGMIRLIRSAAGEPPEPIGRFLIGDGG